MRLARHMRERAEFERSAARWMQSKIRVWTPTMTDEMHRALDSAAWCERKAGELEAQVAKEKT